MKSRVIIRDDNEDNIKGIVEDFKREYPSKTVTIDPNNEVYYDINISQIPNIGTDLFTYFGLAVVEEITFSLIKKYPTHIWIRLI